MQGTGRCPGSQEQPELGVTGIVVGEATRSKQNNGTKAALELAQRRVLVRSGLCHWFPKGNEVLEALLTTQPHQGKEEGKKEEMDVPRH